MKTEVTIVDPKEFGLEETKGKTIESAFTQKMIERDAFAEQYSTIIASELNAETFKAARELRLKLVKVRTGISDVHKTEKAFYLASGKYVDALKNKLTVPIEQMEEKLKEIEEYEAKQEADRKAKLKAERLEMLAPYEVVGLENISIAYMNDEQFASFLSTNKLAFETRAEQARLAEVARIEAEQKAEADRLAKIQDDKKERERIEAENAKLKAEAETMEKELAIERKKQAEEQAKKDAIAKAAADKLAKENAEIKAKADKLQAEQDAERARIEAEEADKIAKAKALLLAPDKEKVKAFAIEFGRLSFPELSTKEGKSMMLKVNSEIEKLKAFINNEYKSMK